MWTEQELLKDHPIDPIEAIKAHTKVLEKLKERRPREIHELVNNAMTRIDQILSFTSLCSNNSEIERLMAIHINEWVAKQRCPGEYRLLPQYHLIVNNRDRYLDFLLTRETQHGTRKLAIECDGKHHKKPEVKKEDEEKDISLEYEYGIYTVRFTGRHIYETPEKCIERIAAVMKIADCYGRRCDD
jgi:hypothetical protein